MRLSWFERRHRRVSDRGAAAVEFALVFPILLLFVLGIINFGFVFSQQLSLNNAVREGARRAVVSDPSAPRTCDGIITSVQNQLSGLGLNASNVQVKVTQDGFPNAYACGNTFQPASFGANGAKIPCTGSLDTDTNPTTNVGARSLIVEAQYVSSIPVALPPFPNTLTLTSKAVFRCEFTA